MGPLKVIYRYVFSPWIHIAERNYVISSRQPQNVFAPVISSTLVARACCARACRTSKTREGKIPSIQTRSKGSMDCCLPSQTSRSGRACNTATQKTTGTRRLPETIGHEQRHNPETRGDIYLHSRLRFAPGKAIFSHHGMITDGKIPLTAEIGEALGLT